MSDPNEQAGDTTILGRLTRVETLLGKEQGIIERLNNLEKRISNLEQAVGEAEVARVVKEHDEQQRAPPAKLAHPSTVAIVVKEHAEQQRAPPVNLHPALQPAVSASPEPADENKPLAAAPVAGTANKDSNDDDEYSCEPNSRLQAQLKSFARKEIFKCMKFLPPRDEELWAGCSLRARPVALVHFLRDPKTTS